jgi:glycopeptide antibiotics resistance protein
MIMEDVKCGKRKWLDLKIAHYNFIVYNGCLIKITKLSKYKYR